MAITWQPYGNPIANLSMAIPWQTHSSSIRNACGNHQVKGIYLKFRSSDHKTGQIGKISEITFERVVIDGPEQWAIWVRAIRYSSRSHQIVIR